MLFMAFTLGEVVRARGVQRLEWAAESSSEVLCRWGLTTGGVLVVRTAVSHGVISSSFVVC